MMRYSVFLLCIGLMCACDVNPAERINAGNIDYDRGRYFEALKAYQSAQVASPDRPEAYFNAGTALSRIGDFDESVEAFNQALKTSDPELSARIYFNLGNLYYDAMRYDDAIHAYQQVLLYKPDDADARYNLEVALQSQLGTSPKPTTFSDMATASWNDVLATPTANPDFGEGSTLLTDDASTVIQNSISSSSLTDVPATYTVEEARDLLDVVQQAQQPYPVSTIGPPSQTNSNKDW